MLNDSGEHLIEQSANLKLQRPTVDKPISSAGGAIPMWEVVVCAKGIESYEVILPRNSYFIGEWQMEIL
jgi:hypothetical protein